eukprot:3933684-Rhodomonas_salina.1
MEAQLERLEKCNSIVSISPAALEEVPEVDRPLVSNVIYAILACKHPERLCTSWSVACTPVHHVVSGILPENGFDISLVDMEFLHSLNPLRISSISVVCSDTKSKLVVKVLNHKQRVQLTAGELVITQKRRRMWA